MYEKLKNVITGISAYDGEPGIQTGGGKSAEVCLPLSLGHLLNETEESPAIFKVSLFLSQISAVELGKFH